MFYRVAGDPNAPVVLLLHGFPASSFMFRELIPRLANDYRVIAPDLPGFGFTEVLAERKYVYSFDGLASTIEAFTQALKINRYAIYVFDYGAPNRLPLGDGSPGTSHSDRFAERKCVRRRSWRCLGSDPEILGFAHGRKPRRDPQKRFDAGGNALAVHARRSRSRQRSAGVVHFGLRRCCERPGNKDIQLDLFLDYASNVKLYPKFQEYFRKSKPPLLAIWGKNDPFFIPAGAEAFRKDIPNAKVQFLDTGHFAIETHVVEIASAMKDFLAANGLEGHATENATKR